MNKLNYFVKNKKGSIAVESSIVFPMLFLVIFFALEMGRLLFLSSALDLMTINIARRASLTENIEQNSTSYSSIFYDQLSEELTLWSILTSKSNLTVDVKFCNSIQQVIDDKCAETSNDDSQMILYSVNYQYNDLFKSLFNNLAKTSLNKKTIVYREFHS